MRVLFALRAYDNDLAPSVPILFPSCDHNYLRKEKNNIPLRSSVVRVLFIFRGSDNDLAPSESISLPSCDHYYLRKRREQHTSKIQCCESVIDFESI